MNTRQYINSRFEKIISENINEKADAILQRLNYDEEAPFNPAGEAFDYVQEGNRETCNECGSEMYEGECLECGSKGEVMELGGMDDGHPKYGKMNFSKLSRKEIEKIMKDMDNMEDDDEEEFVDYDDIDYGDMDDDEEEYYPELRIPHDMPSYKTKYRHSDDEDDEWEEVDLDTETDWDQLEEDECTECGDMYEIELDEKLYGNQTKLDKNKNGRIDREDFKMLRKQQDEEETLYEVEFEKDEFKEESKPDFLDLDKDGNKKESMKSAAKSKKMKGKVTESLIFTENELISLIEKTVNEEKKFKMSEPKGYQEYEKAHRKDKKENEDYLKMVAKKMTDYLKGMSDKESKYEMKETQKFPTENGGKRKKYTPSEAVDEYIDAFSYPGQTNLVYDEIKPNDERIEKYLKGDSTTGNAQVDKDGKALGNVVPSEVGEKFFKNYKDNLYGQEQQQASYKRQTQPVDQAGEVTERGSLKSKKGKKTAQSVLNKVEESVNQKEKQKLTEEFQRIQNLMGYNQKTQ